VKWNLPVAGALLAALPTLLVYIVFGRYFIRGLLAGSIKGRAPLRRPDGLYPSGRILYSGSMLKARILVVEDERLVGLALEQCLKAIGHEVVDLVTTGKEAMRKAGELEPDLVLMDIRLKGEVDGIEAAVRIHESFNTPIVYLTAYSDDNTLERARAAQPYGYVLKPFEEKSLKSAVAMALYTASINARELRTRERLARILADLAEGVIVADVKGNISFLNPRASELLGWQPEAAVGKFFGQVFQLLDRGTGTAVTLPVSRVLLEGEGVSLPDSLLQVEGGGSLNVDVNLSPTRNAAGSIEGLVLTFHPVANRL
jgi:two-component system cell cycle sensor histidine kinase/response regulator CckA